MSNFHVHEHDFDDDPATAWQRERDAEVVAAAAAVNTPQLRGFVDDVAADPAWSHLDNRTARHNRVERGEVVARKRNAASVTERMERFTETRHDAQQRVFAEREQAAQAAYQFRDGDNFLARARSEGYGKR